MARRFKYSVDRKIINWCILRMLELGIAPRSYYLLTVVGRKSGQPHSVPVVIVEAESKRWLVAPYGEMDWVKNARAAGEVNLKQKEYSENLAIRELSSREAAPVLKQYLIENPITRSYFDAGVDSSVDDFLDEARTQPVFELLKTDDGLRGG